MTTNGAQTSKRNGGALVSLCVVVLGWIVLRAAFWEAPFRPSGFERPTLLAAKDETVVEAGLRQRLTAKLPTKIATRSFSEWRSAAFLPKTERNSNALLQLYVQEAGPSIPALGRKLPKTKGMVPNTQMSALGPTTGSNYPARSFLRDYAVAPSRHSTAMRGQTPDQRWSMDGWALWRDGSASPLVAGQPSYGRSQAGAVLRYHLAQSSGHAPQAFARITAALEGPREREAAIGLSARPLSSVPIRFAAEARVTQTGGGTQPRAAIYAVSEIPPIAFRVGAARGRISADYRFRIAGDAEPASGPALTLSVGF